VAAWLSSTLLFLKIINNANDYSDSSMNKTLQGHFTMSTSMQWMH